MMPTQAFDGRTAGSEIARMNGDIAPTRPDDEYAEDIVDNKNDEEE